MNTFNHGDIEVTGPHSKFACSMQDSFGGEGIRLDDALNHHSISGKYLLRHKGFDRPYGFCIMKGAIFEEHMPSEVLFQIDYIHIEPEQRRKGYSAFFLPPLLAQLDAALLDEVIPPAAYMRYHSDEVTPEGDRFSQSLVEKLRPIASKFGMELITKDRFSKNNKTLD
jgi:hypothetical protein